MCGILSLALLLGALLGGSLRPGSFRGHLGFGFLSRRLSFSLSASFRLSFGGSLWLCGSLGSPGFGFLSCFGPYLFGRLWLRLSLGFLSRLLSSRGLLRLGRSGNLGWGSGFCLSSFTLG